MSNKIYQATIGLLLIGSSLSLTTLPAQAESRAAQCQRFDHAMNTFARQLATAKKGNRNPISNLNRWLNISEKSLKQLQNKQFSDPQVQAFQQKALDIYVNVHNSMIGIANSVEARDRQAAMLAYGKLFKSIQPEKQLKRQLSNYCRHL
ncbi:hypothetical protein IQ266_02550 [filamentous cyanobacterium LEGE 11480]|uniref:Uncharacterized protein n=1 Tax=Romeriopsis navalis LEGE 11480 TaxID=2777977 RepID=A0A928Z236_9CYAN|nr:hypothetical protein [Romeriopsis navalis]MBE9028637.1 hypothetical protein [Romeriopsis navalis LEGE 11480]